MIYKDTRTDILDLIPKGGICVEIGVFTGDFSKEILNRISPDILYLVDIWSGTMTSGDKDGLNIKTIENMEENDMPYISIIKDLIDDNGLTKIEYFSDYCHLDYSKIKDILHLKFKEYIS